MIEIACTCDEGFGVPHSHVYEHHRIPGDNVPVARPCDTGWLRIWIDWKAVARA